MAAPTPVESPPPAYPKTPLVEIATPAVGPNIRGGHSSLSQDCDGGSIKLQFAFTLLGIECCVSILNAFYSNFFLLWQTFTCI